MAEKSGLDEPSSSIRSMATTFAWLHNGRRTELRDYTLRADQFHDLAELLEH